MKCECRCDGPLYGVRAVNTTTYDTDDYWVVRGSFAEKRTKLAGLPREQLEGIILDSHYNDFLAQRADYPTGDDDKHGHGKRLPYIGWYWRHIAFSRGGVPIGDCGQFIGFMANNKWYYDERNLTEAEQSEVLRIIDDAIALSQKGGNLREIEDTTNAKLDELWDYLQTLSV